MEIEKLSLLRLIPLPDLDPISSPHHLQSLTWIKSLSLSSFLPKLSQLDSSHWLQTAWFFLIYMKVSWSLSSSTLSSSSLLFRTKWLEIVVCNSVSVSSYSALLCLDFSWIDLSTEIILPEITHDYTLAEPHLMFFIPICASQHSCCKLPQLI